MPKHWQPLAPLFQIHSFSSMTIEQAANVLIPKADGGKRVTYPQDAVTADIIKEVLSYYGQSKNDLDAFAPLLRGANTLQTCSNIWHFVKKHIRYVEDAPGVQWIKTPARIWQDRFCDCKGYSIFIACCLHSLRIPASFRFVSFSKKIPDATHVYVVVKNGRHEIKLDCVLPSFNEEKPYASKQDFEMTQIARLSGIDTRYSRPQALARHKFGRPVILPDMAPAVLIQSAKALEVAEAEMIAESHAGTLSDSRLVQYQQCIADIKKAIAILESPGVGKLNLKKLLTGGKRNKIKAALSDINVASIFLYAFIPSGNPAGRALLANLPEAIQQKRALQLELANWLANKSVYGIATFMADVRATITRAKGKEPEAVLNELLGLDIKSKEAGVGGLFKKNPAKTAKKAEKKTAKAAKKLAEPDKAKAKKEFAGNLLNEGLSIAADTFPFGNTLLSIGKGLFSVFTGAKNKIESDFGFKVPTNLDPAAIGPTAEDFGQATQSQTETEKDLLPIPKAPTLVDNVVANAPTGGFNELLATIKNQFTQMNKAYASPYGNNSLATEADPNTLEDVEVIAPRVVQQAASTGSNNNNTMMMVGIAAVAVLALSRK